MRLIADFILALTDLVEAEGRTLRDVVMRILVACILLLVSLGLFLGSMGLVVYGFYLGLVSTLEPMWATFAAGGIALLLAAIVVLCAKLYVK